jgi:hypothetical protein
MTDHAMLQVGVLERQIEQVAGIPPKYAGGGRGQRAEITYRGEVLTGLGSSRQAALESLIAEIAAATPLAPAPKPKTSRVSVDDAIERIGKAQGREIQTRSSESAPNGHPEPVWRADGRSVAAVYPCSGECLVSEARTCRCECAGTLHGLLWAVIGGVRPSPVVIGPKPCACGCGGITQRKWVPGHDAKAHSRALAQAKANGGD